MFLRKILINSNYNLTKIYHKKKGRYFIYLKTQVANNIAI